MRIVRADWMRGSRQKFLKRRWCAVDGGRMDPLAIIGPKGPESGSAQSQGLFEHRVEHRSEVARRAIDDLQYLGGRGLLLEGLARLGQQPRILHRDDRLRREILQQRDLLV